MKYYIKIRGSVRGPFDVRQIQTLLQQGKIGKYNEISEDNVDWRPLKDVLGGGARTTKGTPSTANAPSGGDFGGSGGSGNFSGFENFNRSDNSDAFDGADDDLQLVDAQSSGNADSDGASEDAVWFVSNDGVSGTGPYTTAEVWRLLKTRRATPNSFVWLEGLPARPLKDVPEFGKATEIDGDAPDSTRSGVALQGEKRCQSCREPVPVGSAFCPKCGAANPTDGPRRVCPRCAAPASLSAEKCPKCGCRLVYQRRKSRLIYVVLGLLGGIVGAHTFYSGRRIEARKQFSLAATGAVLLTLRAFAERLLSSTPFAERVEQILLAVAVFGFAILGLWILRDLFFVKTSVDGLTFTSLFGGDDVSEPDDADD